MSKTPLSPIQRVVNSVWKAVRMLEDRPVPTSKVKLHGGAAMVTPIFRHRIEPLTAIDPRPMRGHGEAVYA